MNWQALLLSFHLLAVISWFAGLLYLPRLFIYQQQQEFDSETWKLFSLMQRRLYFQIMTPAMLAVLVSGIGLIWMTAQIPLWLQVKLGAVAFLIYFHGILGKAVKRRSNSNSKAEFFENLSIEKAWRWANEIPLLPLVLILLMVFFRPY